MFDPAVEGHLPSRSRGMNIVSPAQPPFALSPHPSGFRQLLLCSFCASSRPPLRVISRNRLAKMGLGVGKGRGRRLERCRNRGRRGESKDANHSLNTLLGLGACLTTNRPNPTRMNPVPAPAPRRASEGAARRSGNVSSPA